MINFIFVCYSHGAGGENFSHKLSIDNRCKTLQVKKQGGRTIILNDIFEKAFLEYPLRRENITDYIAEQIKKSNKDKIHIVPSHNTPETIRKLVPNSRCVKIVLPRDYINRDKLLNHLRDAFWNYNTGDTRELVGEIKSKFSYYDLKFNDSDVADILKQCKANTTFGDIHCLVNGLVPTEENKEMLFDRYKKDYNWNFDMGDNSLDISVPYEDVKKCDAREIINQLID